MAYTTLVIENNEGDEDVRESEVRCIRKRKLRELRENKVRFSGHTRERELT